MPIWEVDTGNLDKMTKEIDLEMKKRDVGTVGGWGWRGWLKRTQNWTTFQIVSGTEEQKRQEATCQWFGLTANSFLQNFFERSHLFRFSMQWTQNGLLLLSTISWGGGWKSFWSLQTEVTWKFSPRLRSSESKAPFVWHLDKCVKLL